jgi:hypothetical protein
MKNIKGYIIRRFKYNRRKLFFLFLIITKVQIGFGQFDEPYSENDYGLMRTERNWPDIENKTDSTLLPCRKLVSKPTIFQMPGRIENISDFVHKPYNELTHNEKYSIIQKAWQTKDSCLFRIAIRIAKDTSSDSASQAENINNEVNKEASIICLGQYNSDASKKVLVDLLKNKEWGMTSALSLVQLGLFDEGFNYIKGHYSQEGDKTFINTALMLVKTPEAIKLLMKISNDVNPSNALDALAALSLLGYCDFAFKGFCRYVHNDMSQVREKAVWCLAYYTGTHESFNVIKTLQNDDNDYVREDINKIWKIYNIKN